MIGTGQVSQTSADELRGSRMCGLQRCRGSRLNTFRQVSLYIVASVIGAAGVGVLAMAGERLAVDSPDGNRIAIFAILLLATLVCSRFPLRFGLRDSYIVLDSIPLLLAAVLLPTPDAVVVIALAGVANQIGQPPLLPGLAGWFWRAQLPLTSAAVMFVTSTLAHVGYGIDGRAMAVTLVPAFVLAVVLEALSDLGVLVELEATDPGSGPRLFRHAMFPVAANVFLPTFAVAALSPYANVVWQFAVLLPILMVGMYGALWVANSQQREKRRGDRLKDTFSRYVPEGIVNDNIETMQEIELGGEQQEISVLFCDIRGFTSWSEDKGAKEVITELNVLLTELSLSVMSTGGTLDKFTGDGLMAFWGAPVPVEDHADRAARAALDMLERLHAVNERRAEEGQSPFAIGVAVHSGPAVVGNVGHERRLDYTAIGDTVNTTARLESSTKELGAVLLVSRSTVDKLGEELRGRAMLVGDVTMKGKSRVVQAWALQPRRPELDGVDDEFAA